MSAGTMLDEGVGGDWTRGRVPLCSVEEAEEVHVEEGGHDVAEEEEGCVRARSECRCVSESPF